MSLPVEVSVHNILVFLEYLYINSLSPKVIKNYLSSISSMARQLNFDTSNCYHHMVQRYLRSISINSKFAPTPRGLFDIKTLYYISLSCDTLSDPILFRAIFLTAYFGFLRMSNFAPHSLSKFHPDKHFLRRDLTFAPPGVHLLVKWTKTLQDHKSNHVIQLPELENIFCAQLGPLRPSLPQDPYLHLPLYLPIVIILTIKSLIHTLDMPLNKSLSSGIYLPLAMDFIHFVGQGLPMLSIIMWPYRISWPMDYGEVPPSGLTSRMLPKQLPSFLSPFLLPFPPIFDLGLVL